MRDLLAIAKFLVFVAVSKTILRISDSHLLDFVSCSTGFHVFVLWQSLSLSIVVSHNPLRGRHSSLHVVLTLLA